MLKNDPGHIRELCPKGKNAEDENEIFNGLETLSNYFLSLSNFLRKLIVLGYGKEAKYQKIER